MIVQYFLLRFEAGADADVALGNEKEYVSGAEVAVGNAERER